MSGPSNKPKGKEPSYGPHPDDEDAVREGIEAAERGDALTPEESEAYVRSLVGDASTDA